MIVALVHNVMVLAQTICTLPQCEACKGVDPNSWEWILKGCWIFGSPVAGPLAIGVTMAGYVFVQMWAHRTK